MKNIFILLLLFSVCRSNASHAKTEKPLVSDPSVSSPAISNIQTRTYTSGWTNAQYTVTFDGTHILEKRNPGRDEFEIQGRGTLPSYLHVTMHKLQSPEQTPNQIVDINYDPKHPKAEVAPIKLGENQVYFFLAPELSSAYTEFAVMMLNGEALVVMFQAAGPGKEAIDADRATFMKFLEQIKYDQVPLL